MRTYVVVLGICSLAAFAAVSAAPPAAQTEDTLLAQATQAQNAHDWTRAETAFKQLTAMNPGRWQYSQGLGDAEMHQGNYAEAVNAYKAALDIAVKEKLQATRQAMADMYTNQGNAYLKLQRYDEAVADYSKAAPLSDAPGKVYFNSCAVYYNLGKVDQALEACDKAIAADPNIANAYFIRGSILMGNATIQTGGKIIYPPGTAEALQMYLKLAPTGSHAADVQQMLDYIDGKTN